MASVTKIGKEKTMSDEDLPEAQGPDKEDLAESKSESGADEAKRKPGALPSAAKAAGGAGYFTIYKRGQGYWTRVGTVIGAALLGLFTAANLYEYVPTFLPGSAEMTRKFTIGVVAAFLVGYVFLCWRLLNKPGNVDFLIATDSEMKKVNWSSRRDLIGSTKVVVAFMFITAFFLFAVDLIFGWLMYLINVLKVNPFNL